MTLSFYQCDPEEVLPKENVAQLRLDVAHHIELYADIDTAFDSAERTRLFFDAPLQSYDDTQIKRKLKALTGGDVRLDNRGTNPVASNKATKAHRAVTTSVLAGAHTSAHKLP